MAKVLKLRKKEVPYEEIQAPLGQLAFYPENPRIYSQFAGSGDRTQENIQAKLEGMDHVKELRSQIDRDGQVNEALFCIGFRTGRNCMAGTSTRCWKGTAGLPPCG